MEKEFRNLQQENDSLKNHVALLENQSMNITEKDHLLDQLKSKYLLKSILLFILKTKFTSRDVNLVLLKIWYHINLVTIK